MPSVCEKMSGNAVFFGTSVVTYEWDSSMLIMEILTMELGGDRDPDKDPDDGVRW